jgi:hypothetical protein
MFTISVLLIVMHLHVFDFIHNFINFQIFTKEKEDKSQKGLAWRLSDVIVQYDIYVKCTHHN